ncbi:MAG: hypothetical protein ACNS62_16990 [Candidatus Cyclobacteriaceae bacterium M3_2C_046]
MKKAISIFTIVVGMTILSCNKYPSDFIAELETEQFRVQRTSFQLPEVMDFDSWSE